MSVFTCNIGPPAASCNAINVLQFKTGVNTDDVTFSRAGDPLIAQINSTTDQMPGRYTGQRNGRVCPALGKPDFACGRLSDDIESGDCRKPEVSFTL